MFPVYGGTVMKFVFMYAAAAPLMFLAVYINPLFGFFVCAALFGAIHGVDLN